MTALERFRREDLCPLCGGPKSICQAPYGEYLYGTDPPIRCNVMTAIRQAQSTRREDKHADALIFPPRVRPWGSA